MQTITIRAERSSDIAAIRAVNRAAFPTTTEADLVDKLRANQRLTISLVAETAGRVVGHIAFTPVCVAGSEKGQGLGPIAVVPECQRRGIGGQLIQEGLEACDFAGIEFVVLLGEPAYYARFGFRPAAEWGLVDEYGGGEAFQAIELRDGAIPQGAGLVRYAPEFAVA